MGGQQCFKIGLKKTKQGNIKLKSKSKIKFIFASHQKRRGKINKEVIPIIYLTALKDNVAVLSKQQPLDTTSHTSCLFVSSQSLRLMIMVHTHTHPYLSPSVDMWVFLSAHSVSDKYCLRTNQTQRQDSFCSNQCKYS